MTLRAFRAATLLKRNSTTDVLKLNTCFEEHLQTAACYNVVQIRLRQHCTKNLLVQCCPRSHIEAVTRGVL